MQQEMHSLAQEIIHSYKNRVASITALRDKATSQRQAAQAQLYELDRTRQNMAQQQRASLAKGQMDLIQATQAQLHKLGKDRQDTAMQQQASLSKGHAELIQANTQHKSRVSAWIKDVAAAHQAMAKQQQANLAKQKANIAQTVAAWINDVAAAHQAMAKQQQANLAKQRADIAQASTQRKSKANAWLSQVSAEHAVGQKEWQILAATIRAMRTSTNSGTNKLPSELASLSSRVFEHLANHPDGTRLAELEQVFALSRVQMARVVKDLINQGKAKKQDLLYFAM